MEVQHSFLIHSFTVGHLGFFQHLAIVNNTAMNIGVHRIFWIAVSEFLGYNPSSGIARSKAVPFLVFWRNPILFSTAAAPVCISTSSVLGFPFSTSSSAPVVCWNVNDGHFWLVWGGISLWFYFASLWWLVILSTLVSYAYGPFHFILGNVHSFMSIAHFLFGFLVFLMLSHMSCLYILEIKLLTRYHWQICFPTWLVPFLFWWCFL